MNLVYIVMYEYELITHIFQVCKKKKDADTLVKELNEDEGAFGYCYWVETWEVE